MKTTTFKTLFALLALLFAGLAFLPTTADARSHRSIVGYQSCGAPIYRIATFCHYDSCGRPVYNYRTETAHTHCACKRRVVPHSRSRIPLSIPGATRHSFNRSPSKGCSTGRSYYSGRSRR